MARIEIKSEADRVPAAIGFVKNKIEELDFAINDCDYVEDVNGKPQYERGAYAEEKRQLENEKRPWEIILTILTADAPASVMDW